MNKALVSIAISGIMLLAFCGNHVYYEGFEDRYEVHDANIVKLLVGALVGVVVAGALMPIIANQTAVLETDSVGDLSTQEESLIGLWPLLVIVGVMIAIIGFAL